MPYQALVKTTQHMAGHYGYQFEKPEDRAEFVRRPDVWWYFYPEADEFYFGSSDDEGPSWSSPRSGMGGWLKGGAWAAQLERERVPSPLMNQEGPPPDLSRPPAPAPEESRW